VISINGLVRNYDKLLKVGELNLKTPILELFGYIGPNGGGKIIIIKLLAGLLKPSSGTTYIDDVDIKQGHMRVNE